MEVDDVLASIQSFDNRQKQKELSLSKFDEKVAKLILATIGEEDKHLAIRHEAKVKTGKGYLTVAGVLAHFPYIPIWLTTTKLPYIFNLPAALLWESFERTPIYKAWSSARDEATYDVPAGVVFKWPTIKKGLMICHDYAYSNADAGTFLTYRSIPDGQPLFIERFQPFLSWVVTHS